MFTAGLALAFLYLLPGSMAARVFAGRARWNPFLWVVLSLICLPVALNGLGTLGLPMRSRASVTAAVAAVSLILFLLTEVAKRGGHILSVPAALAGEQARAPRWLAALCVVGLTVFVATTRRALAAGLTSSVVDDEFRIAHLTAIAVTGVPPHSAFLPEAPLSYYYYDLVLPGLAVRLAEPYLSMAYAVVVHVVLQTLALSAVLVAAVFRLVRPWPALIGSLWLCFGATWGIWPLSLIRTRPAFSTVPFSEGRFFLDLFAKLNVWVPQHVIAGAAVVFAAMLISCVEGDLWLRAVILGIVLAFVAGSSVFISISLGLAIAVWFLLSQPRREGAWSRRETLLAMAVAAALSLPLLPTYRQRNLQFAPNVVAEQGGAPSTADGTGPDAPWLGSFLRTQALTAWRIPVHLLVEGGVSFALFAMWLWRERRRLRSDPLVGFLAAAGVVFVPLPYLIRSLLFNDFGMRGIVTAQFAWVIGAVLLLDGLPRRRLRVALWGVALAGTAATLPALADDYEYSTRPQAPVPRYAVYLNQRTRLDDPVVIADGLSYVRSISRFRLERIRLIDPYYIRRLDALDKQYIQDADALGLPTRPAAIRTRADVCAQAARVGRVSGEVAVLARAASSVDRSLGRPEYSDNEYSVYVTTCPP